MVINRIGVGSLAKVAACLYAGIGLVIGVCVFLVSLLGVGLPTAGEGAVPGWMAPVLGAGAVIVLPLLYGTLGALMLSIAGLLYNLVARTVGGIQIDIDRPL